MTKDRANLQEAYCQYVTNTENSYWEKGTIMDNMIVNFIIDLGNNDSSDSDSGSSIVSDNKDMKSLMSYFIPLYQAISEVLYMILL
jgi:hypothetical protein